MRYSGKGNGKDEKDEKENEETEREREIKRVRKTLDNKERQKKNRMISTF